MREAWYTTPLGLRLLAIEQQKLAEILPFFYGYHLLQIAEAELESCITSSLILHCVNTQSDIISHHASLSILSESIDVVVLNHSLEQASNTPEQHQILREAYRVLIPGGHLVISGFNPWHLFHPKLYLMERKKKWVPVAQLKDWLSLLGFDLDCARLRRHDALRLKTNFKTFFEPIYVLIAVKRVASLTLVKPHWSKPQLGWIQGEEIS